MSIPDHVGKPIHITQGFKVSIPAAKRQHSNDYLKGRAQGYYKHGFPLDLYDWCMAILGDTCGQHHWQEGQGQWLHTGSRLSKTNGNVRDKLYLDFWIRDRRKALIFKLVWHGKL